MKKLHRTLSLTSLVLIVFAGLFAFAQCRQADGPKPSWPEISRETKPWTRWWWLGSAVNNAGLTENMQELAKNGFGGVEITPIYGVKGYEKQSVEFLSPEWMAVLEHTLHEGKRLDLGVDLANASGWPFGGPWIDDDDGCKNLNFKQYTLKEGERLKEKVKFIQQPLVRAVGHSVDISDIRYPLGNNSNLQELALDQVRFGHPMPLQTLMAYSNRGESIELASHVLPDGTLDWQAPAGSWTLFAVFQGWHGKQVERAGKGGEGNVIDHFSEKAIKKFLAVFDENAEGTDISWLRAFYNDSYEVDDAQGESDWTPLFFEEFERRRGYDLKEYLPALFGYDSEEINSRVLCDFRETISDLLLDRFTNVWAGWAKAHNAMIRNQAHGSPANILDLYAASDIPETEGIEPMRIKMATSAGHVSGKQLIACEAATWLDEHFLSTLSAVKQNLDRYLANGVNHIVYHGTPYSPLSEEWPGWMFYASVHFAPTNSWWSHLKAINEYVTRCQSFMQRSIPANDILLYFPIYDSWSEKGRSRLVHFGGPREELTKELSEWLIERGFSFDYISDRQIMQLTGDKNLIKTDGGIYRTILVPSCDHIPLETMQKLVSLANEGATVIFQGRLPLDVPGLADLKSRQQAFAELTESLDFNKDNGISVSVKGEGQLLTGNNVEDMLLLVGVFPEEMAQLGLWVNKVNRVEGTCYFISNWSEKKVDRWVTIQSPGRHAAWFDPMNGSMGKARIELLNEKKSKVYMQLNPGETLILQCYPYGIDLPQYPLWDESETKKVLDGEWTVSFVEGGPSLPASFNTSELKSWTSQSGELEKFSGTACYTISFEKPETEALAWELDLGEVHQSASVFLNGKHLGILVGPSWKLEIGADMMEDVNRLEVRVSNLMANRISDMDRNGVNYKKFYNINFAARKKENTGKDGLFTAANWEPLESGLLGPVTLTALTPVGF